MAIVTNATTAPFPPTTESARLPARDAGQTMKYLFPVETTLRKGNEPAAAQFFLHELRLRHGDAQTLDRLKPVVRSVPKRVQKVAHGVVIELKSVNSN